MGNPELWTAMKVAVRLRETVRGLRRSDPPGMLKRLGVSASVPSSIPGRTLERISLRLTEHTMTENRRPDRVARTLRQLSDCAQPVFRAALTRRPDGVA